MVSRNTSCFRINEKIRGSKTDKFTEQWRKRIGTDIIILFEYKQKYNIMSYDKEIF